MKTRTVTLLSIALLATLAIGAFVTQVLSAPPRARAKAWFYPRTYILDNSVPQPWNVWLHFSPPRTASELDALSIRLEGLYTPSAAPYDHPNQPKIVVPFDGYDVLAAAMTKMGHMTPGQSYLVFLEVTGLLEDGTPFSTGSSGCIVLFIPDCSPP